MTEKLTQSHITPTGVCETSRPWTWVAYLLFGAMTLICYFRLFYGVGLNGLMDESQWVASALLSSIGGRPFVNDLYVQQTASLLYEPLVFIYYKLFGNFGLMLFVRHLYFMLSLTGAYFFFKYYRSKTDVITALSIAAIPMVGTSWGQPSLGYNAIGAIGFGLGALFALRSFELHNDKLSIWSGAAFFFSIASYPTLVIPYMILNLLIAFSCYYLKIRFLRKLLLINAVLGGVMLAFLGVILWRAGLDNLILAYNFSKTLSSVGYFWPKITYGAMLLQGFSPPAWFLAPCFGFWLALWWWRGVPWIIFAVPVSIVMWLQPPPEPGTFHPPLLIILALSGTPLVVRALIRRFRSQWTEIIFWASCLAAVPVICATSGMTLYVTWITTNFCIGPLLVLTTYSNRIKNLSLLTMALPLIIFAHKVVVGLDDSKLNAEQEMFEDGPYAGIWTSKARYDFLEQVQQDIREVENKNAKSILFYDEFPLGYLMSSLYPATRTLFMHGLRESYKVRPFLRSLYEAPANRPDVIFRFKYFQVDGVTSSVLPSQYTVQDVFWNYLPEETGDYVLFRDRNSYSVFVKRPF